MHNLSSVNDFDFESMRSCLFSFLVFMFSRCSGLTCSTFVFFIFRTFEPSAFAGFRGSSCCIFREFGVSGFRFSWVSGFWPSGFRVFDACFLACQLSGFLPFMFSSFRLGFFHLSPEFSTVCSKFAFVSCVSLLFAVLRVLPEIANNRFYPCNNRFYPCNNHFFPCQRPFSKFAPFMFVFVDACPEMF